MFKLAEIKTVEWPVVVNIPKDGGATTKQTFHATFKVLDQDETDGVVGDLLKEIVVGWRGVADEDGHEMPYSEEAKAKLLKISYVRAALFAAWLEFSNGKAAARKN